MNHIVGTAKIVGAPRLQHKEGKGPRATLLLSVRTRLGELRTGAVAYGGLSEEVRDLRENDWVIFSARLERSDRTTSPFTLILTACDRLEIPEAPAAGQNVLGDRVTAALAGVEKM
jgi:hypothetical protein